MSRAVSCLLLSLAIVAAGCGKQPVERAGLTKQPAGKVTVMAASDLILALTEAARVFEKKTGTEVTIVFGSSGLLAGQIENGAPADIFLTASKNFVDQLATMNLVTVSRPFAECPVVLVGKVKSLADLPKPAIGKIAIANPGHAPYGMAARDILMEAGLWESIKIKIVYAENVAQALELVKTGNADAALVARSLFKPNDSGYTSLDGQAYPSVGLWFAMLKHGQTNKAAGRFAGFLGESKTRRIFERYGYKFHGDL